MVYYDPGVIQHFANKLYRKSSRIVALRTIIGVLGGFFAGALAAGLLHPTLAAAGMVHLLAGGAGAAILGTIGYTSGVQKSFSLLLQAQTALCQMMTEANTRAAAQGTAKPPALPPQKTAA